MSQIPTNDQAPAPSESLLGGGDTPLSTNDTLLGPTGGDMPSNTDTVPVLEEPKESDAPVPGLAPLPENASEEQKRDFDNKLRAYMGVPDKPEGYGTFGFSEDVKIDVNSEDYKYYTDVFHKEGISPKQAKGLLEAHEKYARQQIDAYKQKNDKAITDYRSKIKNEFVENLGGNSKYEVFRSTAERGFKATAKGAGMSDTEITGLLNIMGDDPKFLKMFNHIGRSFQEAQLISGAAPSAPEITIEDMFKHMYNKQ